MKQFINVKRVFTVLIILLLLISCRVETDYRPLFDKDLSNADYDSSVWTFKNGILTATADQNILEKGPSLPPQPINLFGQRCSMKILSWI